MYSIQRNPEYWPEPEAFQPERFMPGPDGRSPADAAPHGAWMPFGDGTRSCIGMRFAKQEAHITLARLFQRCGVLLALHPVLARSLHYRCFATLVKLNASRPLPASWYRKREYLHLLGQCSVRGECDRWSAVCW